MKTWFLMFAMAVSALVSAQVVLDLALGHGSVPEMKPVLVHVSEL